MIKNNCGSSKKGILIKDKIILSSKTGNNDKIELEVKMLEILKKLQFPVPSFRLDKIDNVYIIEQQYIENANLYKLSSQSFSFSNEIKQQIKYVIDLLIKHKMVIVDFQFLYTDKNLYIIDPDNIFFIHSNRFEHFHKKVRYKISDVIDKFNHQINTLKQICHL
jgi:hypothetical protein